MPQRVPTVAGRRSGGGRLCAAVLLACTGLLAGCERKTQPRPAATEHQESKAADRAVPERSARPTILFVLFDTLRADRVGAYGHQPSLTPTMDALAAEGVVFEHAIAPAPWTLPSIASLFTGLYPGVHKTTQYVTVRRDGRVTGRVSRLPARFDTLAERLRRSGYQTAAFVANPFIIPRNGFKQGFDHYDASFVGNDTPGSRVNRAIFAWLDARRDERPLFLYVHYMDTHAPYVADEGLVEAQLQRLEQRPRESLRRLTAQEKQERGTYFRKNMLHYVRNPRHRVWFDYADYWAARYDACVRQSDVNLAALIDTLKKRGLWDDALVVLVADHGEALGEHHRWGHGTHAWQNQLAVPLILRWPGHLPAQTRVAATVRLIDVLPTLAGVLALPGEPVQGLDLRPWIDGRRGDPLPALSEAVKKQPGLRTMIHGPWKLFGRVQPQRYELYNLADDPLEQHDLAAQLPQKVAELRKLLEQQVAENQRLGRQTQAEHAAASEQEVQRLRALGYTGDQPASQPTTRP